MPKEIPDKQEAPEIIELPLPSGEFPKLSEMTTDEYRAFIQEFPFSEEAVNRLVEKFEARKKKSES